MNRSSSGMCISVCYREKLPVALNLRRFVIKSTLNGMTMWRLVTLA